MAKIKFPAVKIAKENGYKFPYKFETELECALENADLDWDHGTRDGKNHEFFANYEICVGSYLEALYKELKLN